MPNRIIKESICTSDNIDTLTPFQEVVFYRLLVNCDDYGRMDARPKILASRLFPLRTVRSDQMTEALQALSSAELVSLYEVEGKPFLQMKTWERHQQIRAKRSKYPSPDEGTPAKSVTCNHMISDDIKCPRNPIQKESESESEVVTRTPARFTPPTADQVSAYAQETGRSIDAQRFVDFYAAKGWKVGTTPMKDWRAAVRNWCARDSAPAARQGPKVTVHQQYNQREYTHTDDAADALMGGLP